MYRIARESSPSLYTDPRGGDGGWGGGGGDGEDGGGGQNFGHATKEVLASLYENSSEVVKNAGGAIEEKAKAALKAGEKAGKDALKAGEKAIDDVGDKIKGIFGQ